MGGELMRKLLNLYLEQQQILELLGLQKNKNKIH